MNPLIRFREEFFPKRDAFDRAHGTRTAGRVWRKRLGVPQGDQSYQGIDVGFFDDAIKNLPRSAYSMPFIDLGCGKGRALILAKERGFQKIIGVEFSLRLARAARRYAPFADIFVGDAAGFPFPAQCVIFTHNSFGAETTCRVVENIKAQVGRGFIVYVNPLQSHILREGGLCTADGTIWPIRSA